MCQRAPHAGGDRHEGAPVAKAVWGLGGEADRCPSLAFFTLDAAASRIFGAISVSPAYMTFLYKASYCLFP